MPYCAAPGGPGRETGASFPSPALRSRQRLKGAPAGESPNCLSPEAYLGAAQALVLDAIRERKAAVLAPRARGSALRLAPPQSAHSWGEVGTREGTLGFHQSATFLPSVNRVRSYSGEHARAPDQAPSSAPDRLGAKVRLRRIVVRAGASSGSAESLANHRPSRGLPREQHPAPVPSGLHARVWRAANSHDGGPQPSSERPYPPGWRHPQRGPYVG